MTNLFQTGPNRFQKSFIQNIMVKKVGALLHGMPFPFDCFFPEGIPATEIAAQSSEIHMLTL